MVQNQPKMGLSKNKMPYCYSCNLGGGYICCSDRPILGHVTTIHNIAFGINVGHCYSGTCFSWEFSFKTMISSLIVTETTSCTHLIILSGRYVLHLKTELDTYEGIEGQEWGEVPSRRSSTKGDFSSSKWGESFCLSPEMRVLTRGYLVVATICHHHSWDQSRLCFFGKGCGAISHFYKSKRAHYDDW